MIYSKSKFEQACLKKYLKCGALPQDTEKWALALKNRDGVVYLGDEEGVEPVDFDSLDQLVRYATNLKIKEVLVITGARAWEF